MISESGDGRRILRLAQRVMVAPLSPAEAEIAPKGTTVLVGAIVGFERRANLTLVEIEHGGYSCMIPFPRVRTLDLSTRAGAEAFLDA